MAKLVKLTIEGQQVEVPEGTLIVDAAKKFGIDIPVFCYHPKMEPVGMCRMCLVEIGRPMRDRATGELVKDENGAPRLQYGPKLETACTTPVSEGMDVVGASERVKAGREDILEFLLTSHPLDCPICDKGGECPLQNLTMGYGPGESRFIYDNKFQFPKHVPLGELIMLDRERCIQCARCTRFQSEIVDEPVIGFFQRGRALEIVTFSEPGFDSVFSGNTTDICPVGALTTVDFRFEARPWELKAAASICPHCPVGCNLTLNTRREARAGGRLVVKRVMPRQNELVNEIWICDKGRFGYHFAQAAERLTTPLVRRGAELVPATWDEAFEAAAEGLRNAGQGVTALASGRLANEDAFNLRKLAEGLGGKAILYTSMAGGDQVAQTGVGTDTNFSDMGPETAILVVACDLQEEAPIWWLRVKQAADRGAHLIVLNPRSTKLDQHAAQVLRYPYGGEAAAVLAMVNGLSAKRPDLGANAPQAASRQDYEEAARVFAEAENGVIIFGNEGTGLAGSQALAQACANLLITTNHTGRANNGLIAAWPEGNTQGVWDMGLRPVEDLGTALENVPALYIAAADPAGDSSRLRMMVENAPFVVVQELFMTETARLADVVFPAAPFTEREGSYTNGERRVQRFYPAVPLRPETLADFQITGRLGQRLNLDIESRAPLLVMERISAEAPGYQGVTYRKLAEVQEQWPIVGREDLYYGGTTYGNTQGLGVKLAPVSDTGQPPALAWQQPPQVTAAEGAFLAVPVTRLFDQGQTLIHSRLLAVARIPEAHVVLNPADAAQQNLDGQSSVLLDWPGDSGLDASQPVLVRLDENVPQGIVLVPRSLGIELDGPRAVRLRLAALENTR
jgi:NADH-quinone oxidoreductase subunit G